MKVAVLGMGAIGAPMARNVAQAGHDVVVWNRTPARARAVGLPAAATVRDAVAGADVVVTVVTDGPALAGIAGDLLAAAAPETAWAQMSTIGIAATEVHARRAAEADVAFVDAPVLGSRGPAEAGELTVLAAGPPAARPRVEPVFAAVGRRTLWLGEPPAGNALKLVCNTWVLGLVTTLAETLALARGLGLDGRAFLEAIEGGPLDTAYAHLKGELMLAGDYPPAFRVALARKDLELALAAAGDAGLELELTRAVAEALRAAEDAGHRDDDMAAVFEAVRRAQPAGSS